jgi:hypothetical protein
MAIYDFRRAYLSSLLAVLASTPAFAQQAPHCAETPEAAWSAAQASVKRDDNEALVAAFSPALRARWVAMLAAGTDLLISFSSFGDGINSKQSTDVEATFNAELNSILKKHRAPTIAEIGEPIVKRIEAPDIVERFERVDHAALVREIAKLHIKIEAAKKKTSDGKLRSTMRMRMDFASPLTLSENNAENAMGLAANTSVSFKKFDGCWRIDTLDRGAAPRSLQKQ